MSETFNSENISELEEKLNYFFKDKSILIEALTHPSSGAVVNYERLEFLGDAVLELIISDLLYLKFPKYPEGKLTKLRANIVCSKSLADIASELDLGDYLILGKGEELTGGRSKPSILENAAEALIGAVYLDGGFEKTKFIVGKLFEKTINRKSSEPASDYKTRLQESVHKTLKLPISYNVIDKKGPPHKTIFDVELTVGKKAVCRASGHSKKEAEQNAAKEALDTFDNWQN